METKVLPVSTEAFILARNLLAQGELVAFPTDTVYGLGALVFDGLAVERIYTAKDRPAEKAIPVLIADLSDLDKVALDVPEMAKRLASRYWPGPLTLVVPKDPRLPESISAGPTVGVRVPDHPAARELLRLTGPLAVTSANISGQSNPSTAGDALAQLGGRIALILDGGRTPGGVPSTIVDCTGDDVRILREGPISKSDIISLLSG
jgi:L-threonylcarbamoyladenylate synthase